jgi:hypothetical protein
MTSTDLITLPDQPSDPALFEPLTTDENGILRAHLISGWYKQATVYPALSEPWQETSGILDDLHAAWQTAFDSQQAARKAAAPPEPEPEPEASL